MDHLEPTLETSSAFADAFYSGVQLVAEYIKSSMSMIQGVFPKDQTPIEMPHCKDFGCGGLAWMLSLKLLKHTKHFQAIARQPRVAGDSGRCGFAACRSE